MVYDNAENALRPKAGGLEFHLATKGCNHSGQSRAQEQQRSWLRRGAAAVAQNLEGALARDAVTKPSLTAVRGVVLGTCRTVADVEHVIRAVAAARRAEHKPVVGASA